MALLGWSSPGVLLSPTDPLGLILHFAHLRQTSHPSTTDDHPSNNDCSGDPVTHQTPQSWVSHAILVTSAPLPVPSVPTTVRPR
ncbi:hypothetical protein FJTKL_05492 [Diaporthe vaccinii]|uniref:Uncharacterized protein n=1 Tax=Diaporthe vaccinii TaxID=105482 RepID=A0ABR4FG25_9PEZI